MSLISLPIRRPILTTIAYFIVLILGFVSLSRLAIDLMPEISYPSISVITTYSNVGPQEIEESITRPIEEALAAVQGVDEITSTSSEGRSVVRVLFNWGTDLDVAANDIRDRIDRVIGRLPEDIERPMIRKFDVSAFPIMNIGVSGSMSPLELRQVVEDQVKYRLEKAAGVASVDIWGGLYREIHVDLKAAQMKALNISTNQVLAALRSENRNIPAGQYKRGNYEILIRTQGEFSDLDAIRNTVLTTRQGAPIRIRDVADVNDSYEEVRRLVRINGKPGVRIAVYKQSGTNTVRVADAVKEEIARINRDLPQIQLVPIMDSSIYIRQSINNVGQSLLIGGMLAVLILFVFLRNISSTLIISTAIPVSVIATFGLMYFGNFTLNTITFGGLALGIGMLVDCAIVVLENIFRYREQGNAPTESALVATQEVSSAIIASTLTTIVVFLPVIFIRGISGIIFQQMAFVVSFALFCSLIVSLTLIPMLSARFLHLTRKENVSPVLLRVYNWSETRFKIIEEGYAKLLRWALTHRRVVLLATLVLFIISILLIRFVGVELMPATDQSEVQVNLELAVGTRLELTDQAARSVEDVIFKKVPEATTVLTSVGGGGWGAAGTNTANIRINLVPRSQRKRSSEQIANDLRRQLTGIPGVVIRTRAGQGFFLLRMGTAAANQVAVEIRGYDLVTAQQLAQAADAIIRRIPGITDTEISRKEGSPEQIIRIDREKAADLGLGITTIGEALQTAVGGTQASYFRERGKQYKILVRLSEPDRLDLEELLDLTVVNNRGEPIILRNVAQAVHQEGPVSIERKNQERIITINANFTGRDMGSVVNDIRQQLRQLPIPRDFAILFGGDYEEQQEAFRELMLGLLLALLLIYLVMAGQFESFRDPFVVLFSIPMAIIGVTLTMILTKTIFSMQAFIGCIMLAGIVVNNAIILVDYTNRLRREHGLALAAAILTAGSRRLRPILMTTLTTVLGLLPLSLGLGEGGETQAPLGRVVIGGLLSSTLITLVLVPAVYSVFETRLNAPKKGDT